MGSGERCSPPAQQLRRTPVPPGASRCSSRPNGATRPPSRGSLMDAVFCGQRWFSCWLRHLFQKLFRSCRSCSEVAEELPQELRITPKLSKCWPHLVRCWPSSTDTGQDGAIVGRGSPKLDKVRAKLVEFGQISAKMGKAGPDRPNTWPKLAKFFELGQNLKNGGQTRPTFGHD